MTPRRPTGAGNEQRGGDRAGLLDDSKDRGRTRERLGSELLDQATDLQRDDRTERDRDQGGRDDRHRRDEPRLLDELSGLEGSTEHPTTHIESEREQVPRDADRAKDPSSSDRHR